MTEAALASEYFVENSGYCIICDKRTMFRAKGKWLRGDYMCDGCRTKPRHRALVTVLSLYNPQWKSAVIHESSPGFDYFARLCPKYTSSHYFPDVEPGKTKDGIRCENIEAMTFPDESFDVFITQDVLEHVFNPGAALKEVMRVLKPGGISIFTAPKNKKLLVSEPRCRLNADGTINHMKEEQYHGNPIGDNRSLVTWDYGADFDDLIQYWTGYNTSNFIIRDRTRGIDGEYLDVFVTIKNPGNLLTAGRVDI